MWQYLFASFYVPFSFLTKRGKSLTISTINQLGKASPFSGSETTIWAISNLETHRYKKTITENYCVKLTK